MFEKVKQFVESEYERACSSERYFKPNDCMQRAYGVVMFAIANDVNTQYEKYEELWDKDYWSKFMALR